MLWEIINWPFDFEFLIFYEGKYSSNQYQKMALYQDKRLFFKPVSQLSLCLLFSGWWKCIKGASVYCNWICAICSSWEPVWFRAHFISECIIPVGISQPYSILFGPFCFPGGSHGLFGWSRAKVHFPQNFLLVCCVHKLMMVSHLFIMYERWKLGEVFTFQ